MDNQQGIGTIVGLYLGEGHFSVSKFQRANGKWQFGVEIGFSNSDPALLNYVCDFLDSFPVGYHISQNANGCYQVKVQRHMDIIAVLDKIESHLFGKKKAEAALVRRFINGRYGKASGRNVNRVYTEADHEIVAERRLLRDSSETTRFTRMSIA